MKTRNTGIGYRYLLPVLLLSIPLLTGIAFGAEGKNEWRPTYDLVMMWVNFGILVFLAVKFGRTPVVEFLRGRRLEISMEIDRLEEEKKNITDRVNQALAVADDSEAQLARVRERILEQGEKQRQKIITEAEQQGRLMLQTARHKVRSQLVQARHDFRAELIDAAVAHALKGLPQRMTPEDDRKIQDAYLESVLFVEADSA